MKQNVSFSTEFKIRHRILNDETTKHCIVDGESYSWWLRSVYDSHCECGAYVGFFGTINPFDVYYTDRYNYALFACVI